MLTKKKRSKQSTFWLLFSEGITIARKHPALWFFAVCASLLSVGSEVLFLMNSFESASDGSGIFGTFGFLQELFPSGIGQAVVDFLSRANQADIAALALFFGLGAGIIGLAILSQGALIFGCARALASRSAGFVESVRGGEQSFWTLVQTLFVGKVILWSVAILLGLPIIFITSSGVSTTAAAGWILLFFFIGVPVLLGVSVLLRFSLVAVVTEGIPFLAGLRKSVRIFYGHWLAALELVILLFAVDLFAFALVLVGQLILAIPFGFVMVLFLLIGSLVSAPLGPVLGMLAVVWMLAVLAYTLLVVGSTGTVQMSVWVSFYNHCSEGTLRSFLHRVEERLRAAFAKA